MKKKEEKTFIEILYPNLQNFEYVFVSYIAVPTLNEIMISLLFSKINKISREALISKIFSCRLVSFERKCLISFQTLSILHIDSRWGHCKHNWDTSKLLDRNEQTKKLRCTRLLPTGKSCHSQTWLYFIYIVRELFALKCEILQSRDGNN